MSQQVPERPYWLVCNGERLKQQLPQFFDYRIPIDRCVVSGIQGEPFSLKISKDKYPDGALVCVRGERPDSWDLVFDAVADLAYIYRHLDRPAGDRASSSWEFRGDDWIFGQISVVWILVMRRTEMGAHVDAVATQYNIQSLPRAWLAASADRLLIERLNSLCLDVGGDQPTEPAATRTPTASPRPSPSTTLSGRASLQSPPPLAPEIPLSNAAPSNAAPSNAVPSNAAPLPPRSLADSTAAEGSALGQSAVATPFDPLAFARLAPGLRPRTARITSSMERSITSPSPSRQVGRPSPGPSPGPSHRAAQPLTSGTGIRSPVAGSQQVNLRTSSASPARRPVVLDRASIRGIKRGQDGGRRTKLEASTVSEAGQRNGATPDAGRHRQHAHAQMFPSRANASAPRRRPGSVQGSTLVTAISVDGDESDERDDVGESDKADDVDTADDADAAAGAASTAVVDLADSVVNDADDADSDDSDDDTPLNQLVVRPASRTGVIDVAEFTPRRSQRLSARRALIPHQPDWEAIDLLKSIWHLPRQQYRITVANPEKMSQMMEEIDRKDEERREQEASEWEDVEEDEEKEREDSDLLPLEEIPEGIRMIIGEDAVNEYRRLPPFDDSYERIPATDSGWQMRPKAIKVSKKHKCWNPDDYSVIGFRDAELQERWRRYHYWKQMDERSKKEEKDRKAIERGARSLPRRRA
ncbi:hypothetical protein PHSY_002529 [Pseudozyma hubeiensis SY62]|uniref:Uncharacterized protein n=1 Tax=Pseudozyma hubeiensis (strain SY62) TaxID=1305764 RepID=R9P165_PSEHS|nr:hypothetical protein PHSY_002529 [Pseudozyma hubeiensis SY62]GAC94956.1 hypothetical protein PHSY_002529 [Pseudozyma hubeiensis SY62]